MRSILCHQIVAAVTLLIVLLAQVTASPVAAEQLNDVDERAFDDQAVKHEIRQASFTLAPVRARPTLAPGRGQALAVTQTTSRTSAVGTATTARSTSTSTRRTTSTSTRRSTSTTRRTTSTTSRRTTSTSTKRTSTSTRTTSTRPTTTSRSTTSTTTSNASGATSTAGSGTGSSFAALILQAHNSARAPRNANALTWSTSAADYAKSWADKCVWQHGGAPGLGQNLAASAGYRQSGQQVVDAWMSEESDYNPSQPTYSHFTQVVWKSTTQVGCYQAICNKLINPDGTEVFKGFSPAYYTVCNYSPPGNVQGRYAQNVEKLGS